MSKKRVVITGLGVVTPLGVRLSEFWDNICQGKNGIRNMTKLPSSDYERKMVAEVQGFDSCLENKDTELSKFGQAVSYAVAASRMALEDADLTSESIMSAGVFVGTTMGNQDVVERIINEYSLKNEDELPKEAYKQLEKFKPFCLGIEISKRFNLNGPVMVIPTACAAGNYAIGTATSMIQKDKCEIALAGGADPFSRTCFSIFNRLGANTPDVCKPFDQNRQGMAVGEGAAMLVLESYDHAIQRGAKIYAEIKGYGLSCDAYHPTAPHPEGLGAVLSMQQALGQSKLRPDQIHYISAHGTGTPANDSCEAIAMAEVFNEKLKDIPVSSIKSMIGHCMGAASAIEAVVSALAIQSQKVPPTINTTTLDPQFPIPFNYVPGKAIKTKIENIMSNAFAFGGNVSSIILSKL